MPKRIYVCERCGRTAAAGNNKPHSQHRTKRLFRANIQKVLLEGQTRWLCTRCIQELSFTRRPARSRA